MNYIKISKDIKGIIYNYLTISNYYVNLNKLKVIKYLENAYHFHNNILLTPQQMIVDNIFFHTRYKFNNSSMKWIIN